MPSVLLDFLIMWIVNNMQNLACAISTSHAFFCSVNRYQQRIPKIFNKMLYGLIHIIKNCKHCMGGDQHVTEMFSGL